MALSFLVWGLLHGSVKAARWRRWGGLKVGLVPGLPLLLSSPYTEHGDQEGCVVDSKCASAEADYRGISGFVS